MSATRQLAAILFADIQGYTALMQDDETRAMIIRDKFQKTLTNEIKAHNGRIIQLSGDGALCIFKSAIEATHAAIEIQRQMLQEPNVPLRIGIHSGDVIFEGKNVYGDGVNVASRIESFAVPGSVFISGKVYNEIKNQKDIQTVSLGKFELKNVNEPMEIFAISNEGVLVPEKKMKFEGKGQRDSDKKFQSRNILLTAAVVVIIAVAGFLFRHQISNSTNTNSGSEKSIAVLPFENLSSNKDDEYFADGMCDEILTHISKIADLKVISRTSVLQYKNTKKNLRQIGEELGVSTVLEGTVQKLNDRVRINVQLINAKTDEHIWAQDYDRDLKDVFAIQSEVAEQIAHALEAKFTDKEQKQIKKIPTNNLDAYNLYISANALRDAAGDDTSKVDASIHMMEQAVALDSNFTLAWCMIVQWQTDILWIKEDEGYRRALAKEALDHAIRLEPDLPEVHLAKGIYSYRGERNLDDAMREFDIAQKDIPNNSALLTFRALVLRRQGKWKEALASMDKAFELSPREILTAMNRAELHLETCDFEEASEMLEHAKSIGLNLTDYYDDKCMITLLSGSLQDARKIFDDGMTKSGEGFFTSDYLYRLNSFEGKYSDAIKTMLPLVDSIVFGGNYGSLFIALQYHYLHDEAKAKMYFEKATATLKKKLKGTPDAYYAYCYIGLAYAGLGNSEEAISNLKKAEELVPMEKDAGDGLTAHYVLAMSYCLLSKRDEAIGELQFLQKHPSYYSFYNPLFIAKPDPIWNNLRGDLRFEKLWDGNALIPTFKL